MLQGEFNNQSSKKPREGLLIRAATLGKIEDIEDFIYRGSDINEQALKVLVAHSCAHSDSLEHIFPPIHC